jgi:hypothetical protein
LLPERTGARSDPRHIPKFGETHPETGFDRECASSNPLTPASHSKVRETRSPIMRKARQWRAFAPPRSVSTFRIGDLGGPNREKSPPEAANIPVFGRLRSETWFDRDCRPMNPVRGSANSAWTVSPKCFVRRRLRACQLNDLPPNRPAGPSFTGRPLRPAGCRLGQTSGVGLGPPPSAAAQSHLDVLASPSRLVRFGSGAV